jgi:hypothetical protein
MSIRDEIRARVAEGRLIRLIPVMKNRPEHRRVLMTPSVSEALEGPSEGAALALAWGQARARLEGFIGGDVIATRAPPSKSVKTLLALLEPSSENVWEFRIGSRLSLRVFGRFAARDVFVATNWKPRRWLSEDDHRWRDEMLSCKAAWTRLFPAYPPLSGNTIHDYISKAISL